MQTENTRRRSIAWVAGILLGFSGAFMDNYSGQQILGQSQTINDMGVMEGYTPAGFAWGVGLILLAVVLGVTSVALLFRFRMTRMSDYGVLMVVYGLAMVFIGGSMYLGVVSMMTGVFTSALAMLIVGALMIANGILMRS